MKRAPLLPFLLLAAGCSSGLTYRLDSGPPPRTVAVLPFAGQAQLAELDAARALVLLRLRGRGLDVVADDVTDRCLAEHGWLADPSRYDPVAVDAGTVCAALGVDAVLCGTGFHDSSFNLLLVRRHGYSGELALLRADGSDWWHASHTAAATGGLLLQSGQVLTELQGQRSHGTPMMTLALLDQLIDEALATLPQNDGDRQLPPAPSLADVSVQRQQLGDGRDRVTVTAAAPALAALCFDLEPGPTGVPMAHTEGGFVGQHDLPAGSQLVTVRVRARSAFGGPESRAVVHP